MDIPDPTRENLQSRMDIPDLVVCCATKKWNLLLTFS